MKSLAGAGGVEPKDERLKWTNTGLGNIKSAITGTCRSFDPQHTERYLASYEWRLRKTSSALPASQLKQRPRPTNRSRQFVFERRYRGNQEEQWRRSRDVQPSKLVSMDDLRRCLKHKRAQNDVVTTLQVMLLWTRSAKIAEALLEIDRLGLGGPDWFARASRLSEHIPLLQLNKLGMIFVLLASGLSQREIADRVAAQFGGGTTFDGASQAVRRMLSKSSFGMASILLDLPLAERREQVRIARAKLGIADGQNLTVEQATEVLKTVIEADFNANKREFVGRDPNMQGSPLATRRRQREIADTPEVLQTLGEFRKVVESLVSANQRDIAERD